MIEKRYKDIDLDWYIIDMATAMRQLRRYYDNMETVMAELKAGHTVQTSHALYRLVTEQEEDAE